MPNAPPSGTARYQPDNYTNLGPAKELLAATDNALAIIGGGEEIHLEFTDQLPPRAAGWTRCPAKGR